MLSEIYSAGLSGIDSFIVTVEVDGVYMELTHVYPDLTVHLTLFSAHIAQGEPQRLEHNDLRWITVDEIGAYPFCPADVEILARLRQTGRSV